MLPPALKVAFVVTDGALTARADDGMASIETATAPAMDRRDRRMDLDNLFSPQSDCDHQSSWAADYSYRARGAKVIVRRPKSSARGGSRMDGTAG